MNDRKIYYSFQDIPFKESNTYSTIEPGFFKFSQTEIIQLFIAIFVLTLSFSFVLAPYPAFTHLTEVVGNLPLSFLAITTAFVCHELAHKYMGQKYGYRSEFRMFPQGLLLALLLSVTIRIIFAAPGAVQIFGKPTEEENGKMAVAGPATNLILSGFFTLIWISSSGYIKNIAFFIAFINAFLAFFNLLPFGPIDGMKIFRWKKEVWILAFIISIVFIANLWF
jgi:Zn-dependent protease